FRQCVGDSLKCGVISVERFYELWIALPEFKGYVFERLQNAFEHVEDLALALQEALKRAHTPPADQNRPQRFYNVSSQPLDDPLILTLIALSKRYQVFQNGVEIQRRFFKRRPDVPAVRFEKQVLDGQQM